MVLDQRTLAEVSSLIAGAEERLLAMAADDRVTQEPDMTSRLVHGIELASDAVEGVAIEFTVVEGIGPGAAERQLGADVLGVVRIELGELRITKGFLAQSKRTKSDGLRFRGARDEHFSHWLYRGEQHLERSGVVQVTRPSAKLDEQCENMLKVSPASFVFVFGQDQVGVVGASAVLAHRRSRARRWNSIGTKRLDDFFVHILDCFIGDPSLVAASVPELQALAAQRGASAAMMLRISAAVGTDPR